MMAAGAWPIVFRGGLADPRGYDAYAAMIVSPPPAALCDPGAPPRRPRDERRADAAPRRRPRRPYAAALAAQLSCSPPPRPPRARMRGWRRSPATTSLTHDLARARPPRLAAPRHGRRLGRDRGHAVIRRAFDVAVAAAASHWPRRCWRRRRSRSGSTKPRPGALPPAARRSPTVARFEVIKLRTMVSGRRVHRCGHGGRRRRSSHHARRRAAAPDLARRAAEPRQRAARRDEPDRPAADAARADRGLRRAPAPAPGRQARHHRLGPGQRARLAAVVGARSSSTSTTSSIARCGSTC